MKPAAVSSVLAPAALVLPPMAPAEWHQPAMKFLWAKMARIGWAARI